MPEPAWEVFDRDAQAHSGYLYTATTRLSSTMATSRSRQLLLSAARFARRSVLDVGCGDGFYTLQLWDLTKPRSLIGIDAAARAIDVATSNRGERPIQFAVGDSHVMPFPNNSFDLVLVQSILHHDDDPLATLREAFRVAPEVVIHEPNGNNLGLKIIERVSPYHRRHHERSYTPRRLKGWVEQAGGRVVALQFAGFVPMFAPDWLARIMKRLEPLVEGLPMINAAGCSVYVVLAVRARR